MIVVVAGLFFRGDTVLVTQRKPGVHLAGLWEFPGGKVGDDEEPKGALVRELAEELGVAAIPGEIVEVTFHRYPEKSVLLLFYEVTLTMGSPAPRAVDVAALRWATRAELLTLTFPAADVPVLTKVRARLEALGRS